MAVKIKFDVNNNVVQPTIVLCRKNGNRIGALRYSDLVFKDSMLGDDELTFKVYSNLYDENRSFWDEINDFKTCWVKDWNKVFEIRITSSDSDESVKTIDAISLSKAELSQINLYNIEINTEDDISRDDYSPTIFFDPDHPKSSLLHILLEKVPHYTIGHVDDSLKNVQKIYNFDSISVGDAFNQISEEMNCLFYSHCYYDDNLELKREINIYDLENYGKDTTVFVSTENLASDITYSVDTYSVKNCFMLKAGDDLMTATIASCNPNGSNYLWYFSDNMLNDMSGELKDKLISYDADYSYYSDEYVSDISGDLLSQYNELVEFYQHDPYHSEHQTLPSNITGFSGLIEAYYNTVDFYYFLKETLMPKVSILQTSAQIEASKVLQDLTSVSVSDISIASKPTVTNIVKDMAKIIVDKRYKIEINNDYASYGNNVWVGDIKITNYSDSQDTYTINEISIDVDDNYRQFIEQKLKTLLDQTIDKNGDTEILKLFDKNVEDFEQELVKYSLSLLNTYHDACQSCIDILIQQGISSPSKSQQSEDDLYNDIYIEYYEKLQALERAIVTREQQIILVVGEYKNDELITQGMSTLINDRVSYVQDYLDIRNYIGEELFEELILYRREQLYSNNNFISDGLSNAEIIENAKAFLEEANKEIYRSGNLQHSIQANLVNLLFIKEFKPIVDNFAVGNWIRVKSDDNIYKLRILDYTINFNETQNIEVNFSDVEKTKDSISDIKSILSHSVSMSSSYPYVSRQANKGYKANKTVDDWVNRGFDLTAAKIVDNYDNQKLTMDEHGLLCREYNREYDDYSPKQLKLYSHGLYLTDDNWRTSKAGIGEFTFLNPKTNQLENHYGVIADTVVGNIIFGGELEIYNTENNISLDENGLTITADDTEDTEPIFLIRKKTGDDTYQNLLSVDDQGGLKIGIVDELDQGVANLSESLSGSLEAYKREVGQYITWDSTTGLTLGASADGVTSDYKVNVDNQRLSFLYQNQTTAYMMGNELHVPNAVIDSTMRIGNYVFVPHGNGSMSLMYSEA